MRSWLVIPAIGVVAAAVAAALRVTPAEAAAAGLAGAGLAGGLRALVPDGDSPAAITAATIVPLLAIVSLLDRGGPLGVPCVALAAAGWTLAELGQKARSPLVALVPAAVAAVLEPGLAGLVVLAGLRVPWRRWAIAVPVAGALVIGLAILAGLAHGGALGRLAVAWFGEPPRPIAPELYAVRLGDALGPVTAVAALAGTATLCRARLAELAVAAAVAGALVVDLRAGGVGPVTLGLAALCAGLAVERLAALIRLRPGQAIAGATAGVLLVAPPAWTAIERGPRIANVQASR